MKPSCPRAPALQQKKPLRWGAWKPHLTKARVQRRRPSEAKKTEQSLKCKTLCVVQVSSVAQSCPTLQPHELQHTRTPVHHQLPELTQTHVHWVGDTTQPSHPLLSPSPPAFNLSQHQGLFQWVSSVHQVAKVLEFQLQHRSFQWTPRTDLL